MQTLNLFDVTAVHVSAMQNCDDPLRTTTWRTITIHHEGGQFEVVLFPAQAELPVTVEETQPTETPNPALPSGITLFAETYLTPSM